MVPLPPSPSNTLPLVPLLPGGGTNGAAACSKNAQCALQGLGGDCCPTSDGKTLDCCRVSTSALGAGVVGANNNDLNLQDADHAAAAAAAGGGAA